MVSSHNGSESRWRKVSGFYVWNVFGFESVPVALLFWPKVGQSHLDPVLEPDICRRRCQPLPVSAHEGDHRQSSGRVFEAVRLSGVFFVSLSLTPCIKDSLLRNIIILNFGRINMKFRYSEFQKRGKVCRNYGRI